MEPRLTDEATEVGRVGSALNTLLDHVDSALDARQLSEQQVRQFVADASHELRTPLSTIHGYAELSRRTPDDAMALSTAMGKVETEAIRMSSLVGDLLLLARLDAGRPLERAEVDVTRLLLEAVTDARVVVPRHGWRLELPDQPVTVIGDEQRLHQVVTNLINNATTGSGPSEPCWRPRSSVGSAVLRSPRVVWAKIRAAVGAADKAVRAGSSSAAGLPAHDRTGTSRADASAAVPVGRTASRTGAHLVARPDQHPDRRRARISRSPTLNQ